MSGMHESPNLTEIQRRAIISGMVNLSDAHAKQSLQPASSRALVDAFSAHVGSRSDSRRDLAEFFTAGLSRHTGQPYRPASTHLVYSASIALSVAAQLLRRRACRIVGVITPTVDSVPVHFSNVGLLPTGIPERTLMPECDFDHLEALKLDALVVVTPNNPTGVRLSRTALTQLILWSARCKVVLILDMSFRMLDPQARWDIIDAADGSGADVIVVDDTGKTVSLAGMKLAIISGTKKLRAEVSRVCSDVLLAVPEIDLLLLATVLQTTGPDSEVHRAQDLIRSNAAYLARQLRNVGCLTPSVADAPGSFQPSVAWISVGPARDQIVEACRARLLEVTPGDLFHWDTGRADGKGAHQIRVALLRDAGYFALGADLLAEAMASTTCYTD
jgi:aspartate/methionine/tyrosine aminotransferase